MKLISNYITPVMYIDSTGESATLLLLGVVVFILGVSMSGCNQKSDYLKETEYWDEKFGENKPNQFFSKDNLMFELDRQAYYDAKRYYAGQLVYDGSLLAIELMQLPTGYDEIKTYTIDMFINTVSSNKSLQKFIKETHFYEEIL